MNPIRERGACKLSALEKEEIRFVVVPEDRPISNTIGRNVEGY
jgi:hypothetical protein